MAQEYLVTLNVPPALDGVVVDNLLMMEFERGFSGSIVFSHHHENKGLSLSEQVTGRQKRICFQVYVDDENLVKLLSQLRESFENSGIQYWVIPVLENGVL